MNLIEWHRTTFREFQLAHPADRSGWWRWCGAVAQPCLDIGCGPLTMPGAFGFDVAFGDVVADARNLPLRDASVASVVTSHLLEHVEPIQLVAEISRVLELGGRLLIEAPNLMGLARGYRVWNAGIRDDRYPAAGKTASIALINSVLPLRHFGQIVTRLPVFDVEYPGKDPDAVWWCNSLACARLLIDRGFRIVRARGWLSHTFRFEAEKHHA